MTEHGALSILANIIPGKQEYLTDLLKQVDESREDINGIIPFPKLTSVHFARFVVFAKQNETFPPLKFFCSLCKSNSAVKLMF